MSTTALIFNFLRGRDTVTPHLQRISTAALRSSRQLRFVGQMTGVIWMTAAGAIGGATAHAVAFTQALAPMAGALGALPAIIFGAAAGLAALIVGFRGVGAALKTTGAAAGGANALAAAERRVEQAQKAVLKAQEALNDARAEATRKLADMSRELARTRLDEKSAILSVKEAKLALREARSSGDRLEIERATIAYQQSVFALEDVRVRLADVTAEEQQRREAGVEGSEEVRGAVERQTEALEDLADAQKALTAGGGGVDKAAEAYAKLSAEGKALVDVLKRIGPAWASVRRAVQSAMLAGVAGDLRLLSGAYLPVMLAQLPAIARGWNNAFRGTMQLASTAAFVADMNMSLAATATLWQRIGDSFAPFLSGFRHWVAVGSEFMPRLGGWVLSMAQRFDEWSAKVRSTGQAHKWIEDALVVGKQFGDLLGAWSGSLTKIFQLGADPTFLRDLIAGSQAFRVWLDTAEGQARVTALFATFRDIGSAAWMALKTLLDIISQADLSGVVTSFTLLNAVLKVAADNMGLINAVLPILIPLYVIHKTTVMALRVAYGLQGAAAASAAFYTNVLGKATALASLIFSRATYTTLAQRAATIANAIAARAAAAGQWFLSASITAYDLLTRRAILSTIAARAAMIAGAAATGIVTAAQWLWNIALMANPIGLIILAVIAFIAIIVVLIKYHKEIGAFFTMVWGHIWDFLKMIGAWFAGPFVDFFVNAWNYIVGLFNGGVAWVTGWVNRFLAPILAIKEHIQAVGIWQTLVDGFKAAINSLIGLWNRLDFSIGPFSIPSWVPEIGGKGFHIPDVFPDIPRLDVGGRVLSDGVAVIHKGEEVVPAAEVVQRQRGGGGGVSRLIIGSDGSEDGRYLVERLRKAVRSMGGDFDIVFEN